MIRPRGIDAVYYMVKDVARARRFYEGVLGFEPTQIAERESGDWSGVEYALPTGQTFGLGKNDGVPWRPCGGVMISVADVADATRRVRDAGGVVLAGPIETPVCTMAACEDTEGNALTLHCRKDGTAG